MKYFKILIPVLILIIILCACKDTKEKELLGTIENVTASTIKINDVENNKSYTLNKTNVKTDLYYGKKVKVVYIGNIEKDSVEIVEITEASNNDLDNEKTFEGKVVDNAMSIVTVKDENNNVYDFEKNNVESSLDIGATVKIFYKGKLDKNNPYLKIVTKIVVLKDKEEEKDTSKKTVYDILGDSNKLSPDSLKVHMQWRADAKKLVEENLNDIFINGYTDKKIISLTFDDGPSSVITPEILDILKEYKVKANFFVLGKEVENNKEVTKRIFDEGHLVLNHSYSHPSFSDKSIEFIQNEITSTQKIIKDITGKKPLLFRPPYGEINDNVLTVAKNLNNKLILWSIDTLDWSQMEKDNIVNNVVSNIRPGENILMHCDNAKKETALALPIIIQTLKEKGYEFVGLDELLDVKAYE